MCRPPWREFALKQESVCVCVWVGVPQNKLPVPFSVNIDDLWKIQLLTCRGTAGVPPFRNAGIRNSFREKPDGARVCCLCCAPVNRLHEHEWVVHK